MAMIETDLKRPIFTEQEISEFSDPADIERKPFPQACREGWQAACDKTNQVLTTIHQQRFLLIGATLLVGHLVLDSTMSEHWDSHLDPSQKILLARAQKFCDVNYAENWLGRIFPKLAYDGNQCKEAITDFNLGARPEIANMQTQLSLAATEALSEGEEGAKFKKQVEAWQEHEREQVEKERTEADKAKAGRVRKSEL